VPAYGFSQIDLRKLDSPHWLYDPAAHAFRPAPVQAPPGVLREACERANDQERNVKKIVEITFQQIRHLQDLPSSPPEEFGATLFIDYADGTDARFYANLPEPAAFRKVASVREAIELAIGHADRMAATFALYADRKAEYARKAGALRELLSYPHPVCFTEKHVTFTRDRQDWRDDGEDERVRIDDTL
jgi:hypothetical protein